MTKPLAAKVGERLHSRGEVLVTAESCTGGGVAQAITAVAGSSGWFERGFVTYSDLSKQELLGASAATLSEHGAVSEPTAREMALGALARSTGSISVAVTGIAGPGGATESKPVGTVCFAWATKQGVLRSETRHFDGDRESVRRKSVVRALEGVLEVLDGQHAGG